MNSDEFGEIEVVERRVSIEEIDETFFLKTFENLFLKEVNTMFINQRIVQEEIQEKARHFLSLYKVQKERQELKKKWNFYAEHLSSIDQNDYDKVPWLFPIVLDIRKVYALHCTPQEPTIFENEYPQRKELPKYDVLVNEREQKQQMLKLLEEVKNNIINTIDFTNEYYSLIRPYEEGKEKEGYRTYFPRTVSVFRDSRKFRKTQNEERVHLDYPIKKRTENILVQDFEERQTTAIEIEGEYLYIIGFYILPSYQKQITPLEVESFKQAKETKEIVFQDSYFLLPKKINFQTFSSYIKKVLSLVPPSIPYMTQTQYETYLKSLVYPPIEKISYTKEEQTENYGLIQEDTYLKTLYTIPKGTYVKRLLSLQKTEDGGFFYLLYMYNKLYKQPNIQAKKQEVKKEMNRMKIDILKNKEEQVKNATNLSTLDRLVPSFEKASHRESQYKEKEKFLQSMQKVSIDLYPALRFLVRQKYKKEHQVDITHIYLIVYKEEKRKEQFYSIPTPKEELQKMISYLSTLQPEYRKKVIYSIIQYDGLMIDKFLYSIQYKSPFLCGHWYHLMLIEQSSSIEEQQERVNNMLSVYGIDLNDRKTQNYCSVCGTQLDRDVYMESLHINDRGIPLRFEQVQESIENIYFDESKEDIKKKLIECDEHEIKGELLLLGYKDVRDLNHGVEICNIIRNFTMKTNIPIRSLEVLGIILITLRQKRTIQSRQSYFEEQIREYAIKHKLKPEERENLVTNDKFVQRFHIQYRSYYKLKFYTLVYANILWLYRIKIPSVVPKSKAGCSFHGFEKDRGIEYFRCMLQEMKTLHYSFKIKGRIVEKQVKQEEIDFHLRFWEDVLKVYYEKLLHRKYLYEENLKETQYGDIRDVTFVPLDIKEPKSDPVSLGENILNTKYYIQRFLSMIDTIVTNQHVDTNRLQFTCCPYDMKKDMYATFIEENKDLIDIMYNLDINNIQQYVQQTTYRHVSKIEYTNNLIELSFQQVDEESKKNLYRKYCFEGDTRTERHLFVNKLHESFTRCLKCTRYLKEIDNLTISEKDFFSLYNDIMEKLMTKKYSRKEETLTKNEINNLFKRKKSKELKKLEEEIINKFLTHLIKLVNNNILKVPYTKDIRNSLLKEIQLYFNEFLNVDALFVLKDSSYKQKKLMNIRKNAFKIRLLKTVINNYFRKNIAKIKYGYKIKRKEIDIPWLTTTDKENMIKTSIESEKWLEEFLTKENQKTFQNFTFLYNYQSIENFYGQMIIYSSNFTYARYRSILNFESAYLILKYYLFMELNNFLSNDSAISSKFAHYLYHQMKQIHNDIQVLNISYNEMLKWKLSFRTQQYRLKARFMEYLKQSEILFHNPLRKSYEEMYALPEYNEKLEDDKKEKEQITEEELTEEQLKEEAKESLGEDATQHEIESYVEEQIEKIHEEEEVEKEVYSSERLPEGNHVLDVGTSYGDDPGDIEEEEEPDAKEAFEPIHYPDVTGAEQ